MDTNKTKKSFLIVIVSIIIIAAIIYIFPKKDTTTNTDPLGMQTTDGPWIAEVSHLSARLQSIKLPALPEEGNALHIHQHLDIFIHGKAKPVPPGIGVNPIARYISPLHTHEVDQVIHVESPTVQDFTLGQFFDVWGVRFTMTSIGGYTSDSQNFLKVFVNGKEIAGDPRAIVLTAHQEIAITFGTVEELPKVIPATYTFAEGE